MWNWLLGRNPEEEKPIEASLGGEDLQLAGRLAPNSPTWVFVAGYAREEIAALRCANDRMLDADRTAAIRGQIKALKKLLELEQGPENRSRRIPADDAMFAGEEDYY